MSDKIKANQTLDGNSLSEVTGTLIPGNKFGLDIVVGGGREINPLAKYVEATYTNSDMTVTYSYYESSSKITAYETIIVNYSVAQDTEFTSAEWV